MSIDAGTIMTRKVIAAGPNNSVRTIVRLFSQSGITRAPIVREGKVVGIVRRADLVRGLAVMPDAVSAGD